MKKLKVMIVFGIRFEVIKMVLFVFELRKYFEIDFYVMVIV